MIAGHLVMHGMNHVAASTQWL